MSRTTIHYDCKKQKPRWQIKTTSLQILDHAPPCLLLWQSPMLCAVIVPIPCDELNAVFAWITCQHSAAKVSEDAVVAIQSAGFELRGGFQNRHVFRSHFGGVDYALQRSLRTGGGTLLPVQHAAPAGDATETPFLLSGNEKGRRFFGWSKPTNDAQKFVIFFPR